jgi:hypothetical protein
MPKSRNNIMRRFAIRNKTQILCLALCCAGFWPAIPQAFAQISATVSTNKPSYVIGEPITVTVTAVNNNPFPVTLGFPSSLQSQYVLDNTYVNNEAGLAIFTHAVVPANGTRDYPYSHNWDYYNLSVGSHEVFGNIVGYATSMPITFNILAPPPVTHDVFIDFETFPNGTPLNGIWHTAFAAWGVEFRSDGGGLSLQKDILDSTVLFTPSGDHPFNIVADFDMDVFQVSANVGTAANETVTMSAFDAAGNLLGTVTSNPVTNYPALVSPLSFSSQVPIGSVKWISSNPLATVLVDNLSLKVGAVPEASTMLLASISIGMLSSRLRLR